MRVPGPTPRHPTRGGVLAVLLLIPTLVSGCAFPPARPPAADIPHPAAKASVGAVHPAATAPRGKTPRTSATVAAALRAPLPMGVVQAPAPATAGPPANPGAPVFLSPTLGFVAGQSRARRRPSDRAVIARTTNGGRTWHRIWTSTQAGLTWSTLELGSSPNAGLLYGGGVVGSGVEQRPFFMVSGDRGRTWKARRPTLPQRPLVSSPDLAPGQRQPLAMAMALWSHFRFDFVSRSVGLAGFNPMQDAGGLDNAPLVLITHDGGRVWRKLPLPHDLSAFNGALDFQNPTHGWIGGAQSARCHRLWHTRDAGATWSAATPCIPFPLRTVAFVGRNHGFAAGGNRFHGSAPFQAVLATRDGGRRWRTIYTATRGTRRPLVQLRFTSPTTGLAVEGTAPIMLEESSGSGAVLQTRDGGRHWTTVAHGVTGVALAGPRTAWAATTADALLVTGNGGAAWRIVPHGPEPSLTAVRFLHDNPKVGWLLAGPAMFATADGGATWSPARPTPRANGTTLPWFASESIAVAPGGPGLLRTIDGGRSWSVATALSPTGVGSVSFTDPAHGFAAIPRAAGPDTLEATRDGGASWHPDGTLPIHDAHLAFGRQVWAATGQSGTRSQIAIRDRGGTWHTLAAGDTPGGCQSPSIAGSRIWLLCEPPSPTLPGRTANMLLRSTDGGRRWRAYRAANLRPQSLSMTGPHQGWMTARLAGSRRDGLYATHDGGRNWTRVWPRLPGAP